MTPTPPPNYRIIPREYLEARNPLPDDAIIWSTLRECWKDSTFRGAKPVDYDDGSFDTYATAQPLSCFAPPPNEEEHEPEPLNQDYIPVTIGSIVEDGDEFFNFITGKWTKTSRAGSEVRDTQYYRRRVSLAPSEQPCPQCAGEPCDKCERIAELEVRCRELSARLEEVERERDEALTKTQQNEYCRKALMARRTIEEENAILAELSTARQQLAACEKAMKESIEWIKSRPHDGSCTDKCDCWKSWALTAINSMLEPKEKR